MRALKAVAVAVAALIGLAVLLMLAIWLLFDPNEYKDDVAAAFRRSTGRELQLTGPLSLDVFPWLAVEAHTASIANRPGFGDPAFASLDRARLGVRLWPLLTKRRVEFGPIRVEGLRLYLQVAADGSNNWSDMVAKLQADKNERPAGQRGSGNEFEFSIASLALTRARVSLDDRQAQVRYVIEDWNLATSQLRHGEPFEVQTALVVSRNDARLGRYELRTTFDLGQPGRITLRRTQGKVQFPRPGGAREALTVDLGAPRLSMQTSTRDIDVEQLEARVAGTHLKTSLQVKQGPAGPTVRGPVQLVESNPRKLLDALDIALPRMRDAKAMTRASGTSQLAWSSRDGLVLTSLALQLDETHFNGRLTVRDLARKALRFELRADALELDRYLPPSSKPPPASPATPATLAAAPATDRGKILRTLDAAGSLRLDRMGVAGVRLEQVVIGLTARDGHVGIAPLDARAFGGVASNRLTYDVRQAVPTLHIESALHDIDVDAMFSQLTGVRPLRGRGRAEVTFDTRGRNVAELVHNLRGPFSLGVEDGALVGADLAYEVERAVAVAQHKPSAVTGRNTGQTAFKTLRARGTLANRVVHNDRVEFVSSFARARGHGDVDFARNRLDLDLKATMLAMPPGRLLGIKLSRIEGAEIPMQVTGRIDQPKVQPDVTALLGAVAKSTLTEPLEGKLKDLLKKLPKF